MLSFGNSAALPWKLVNTIFGRLLSLLPWTLVNADGTVVVGGVQLAETTNSYFINKIQKLSDSFNGTTAPPNPLLEDSHAHMDKFISVPLSPTEVIKAIQGLNGTGSSGMDGIPVSVLKLLAPIISLPVAPMIALSFSRVCLPELAIVTPIYKGKGKAAGLLPLINQWHILSINS